MNHHVLWIESQTEDYFLTQLAKPAECAKYPLQAPTFSSFYGLIPIYTDGTMSFLF
jgi:hypothetical protein